MEYYFAKNLRFLRRQSGVTQTKLSAHMKKAHTTIGNWEKQHSRPSIEELLELCRYFNIKVGDFMEKDLTKIHSNGSAYKAPLSSSEAAANSDLPFQSLLDQNLDSANRILILQQYNKLQQKHIALLQEENRLLKQMVNLMEN